MRMNSSYRPQNGVNSNVNGQYNSQYNGINNGMNPTMNNGMNSGMNNINRGTMNSAIMPSVNQYNDLNVADIDRLQNYLESVKLQKLSQNCQPEQVNNFVPRQPQLMGGINERPATLPLKPFNSIVSHGGIITDQELQYDFNNKAPWAVKPSQNYITQDVLCAQSQGQTQRNAVDQVNKPMSLKPKKTGNFYNPYSYGSKQNEFGMITQDRNIGMGGTIPNLDLVDTDRLMRT
jgi:hypothetical protein